MVNELFIEKQGGPRPFRFQCMWCSHPNFLEVARNCWEENVTGCAMVRLSQKIKKLKIVLRKWNMEVFGRFDMQLKAIEENLNNKN